MQLFPVILAAAMELWVLSLAEGEVEPQQTTNCALGRLCRHCTCHIDGKYAQTTFCADRLLESVVVMGTDDCRSPLEEGFLHSFRTKSLGLKDIGMTTLRNDTFEGLIHLEKLDLSNNHINTIEAGTFAKLPKLTTLKLSSNNLAKFPHQALILATNLTNLHLSNNKITMLDAPMDYDKAGNLQTLDVSFNRITTIQKEFIDMFPKLTQLSLHRNRINCGCEHVWVREYQKCLCVFGHERCRSPRNASMYTLINFPVEHCSSVQQMRCNLESICPISHRTVRPRVTKSWQLRPTSHVARWGVFIDPVTIETTTKTLTTTSPSTYNPTKTSQKELAAVVCSSSRQNRRSGLNVVFAFVFVTYACKFLTLNLHSAG